MKHGLFVRLNKVSMAPISTPGSVRGTPLMRSNSRDSLSSSTRELADLKLHIDELNSEKIRLETALKASEEKITKLEIEIQQRPEMDDVIELKKGINTAQENMNELALQKEEEKDLLQKQYNILQETCSKLKADKEHLESFIRTCPKKEEIESLQKKISEMSLSMSSLKQDLDLKERENQKLQIALEKFQNYDEIKASLTEKQNSMEELLRQSSEKDQLLTKMKKEMEDIKGEKAKLIYEIANLSAAHGADQARLQNLEREFTNLTKLYYETSSALENKLKEWKLETAEKLKCLQSVVKENEAATVEMKSLRVSVTSLQNEKAEDKKLITKLTQQVSDYNETIDCLQSTLKICKDDLQILKGILEELLE